MAIRKNHSLRSCRNRQPGFHKSEAVMEHSEGGRRGDSASDRGNTGKDGVANAYIGPVALLCNAWVTWWWKIHQPAVAS